jgi:hypothetical protein
MKAAAWAQTWEGASSVAQQMMDKYRKRRLCIDTESVTDKIRNHPHPPSPPPPIGNRPIQ